MKVFVQFIIFLTCFVVCSQQSLIYQLESLQNQRLKEKVFVHTNKTIYFNDDIIWFKAYVGDSLNKPSVSTTKLYVNLLDDQGAVVDKKNVFIDKGAGFGQFELNGLAATGTYYIQAYTNYMRNFGEDYHHLQKIAVVGEIADQRHSIIANEYAIELLPESGYLLEDAKNTIGIKVSLNGKGFSFSGSIQNGNGEAITSFVSSHLGMAKCELQYQPNQNYIANITINDTILKVNLPEARKKGVILSVDTDDNDYVKVSLLTNKATFDKEDYSKYSVLFHQDEKILDLMSLTRFDTLTGYISIKKSRFINGVNTVTLFDKDIPIAQRKFFIEKNKERIVVEIEESGMESDSIHYTLKIRNQEMPIIGDFSVSILPADSRDLKEKQNLQSVFLLTSLIKKHIVNSAHYFNPENRKRKEHLDLLLLTQPQTLQDLPALVQELNTASKFNFEYGFELKGTLKPAIEYDSIALVRYDYQIIDKIGLNQDASFNFKNLLLYKEDTVNVALIDAANKIIKPKKVNYDSLVERTIPTANIPIKKTYHTSIKSFQQKITAPNEKNVQAKSDTIETAILPDGTIILDEAIVSKKRRSRRYLERKKIIKKYKRVVPDIGRYQDIAIPELYLKHELDVLNYLKGQGIREIGDNPLDIYYADYTGRELILHIDGRLLLQEEIPSIRLRMSEIENVLVSTRGPIEGRLVSAWFYQFFTKKNYNTENNLFDKHKIKEGYDREKKYQPPIYIFNQKRPKHLTEIDWKPNLKTNTEGELYFNIAKKHSTKNLLFSIQGFSNMGHLISETIIKD